MLKNGLLCLFFALLSPAVFAEKSPVSESYKSIVDCYPELDNSRLRSQLALTALKDLVDERFITVSSQLVERTVLFRDSQGIQKRLQHYAKGTSKSGVMGYRLALAKVLSNGVFEPIKLPSHQAVDPSAEVIASFLVSSAVEADRFRYEDQKLNSARLSYVRLGKSLEELELEQASPRRFLRCYTTPESLTICTCSKK